LIINVVFLVAKAVDKGDFFPLLHSDPADEILIRKVVFSSGRTVENFYVLGCFRGCESLIFRQKLRHYTTLSDVY
jgi:hypothetical protein